MTKPPTSGSRWPRRMVVVAALLLAGTLLWRENRSRSPERARPAPRPAVASVAPPTAPKETVTPPLRLMPPDPVPAPATAPVFLRPGPLGNVGLLRLEHFPADSHLRRELTALTPAARAAALAALTKLQFPAKDIDSLHVDRLGAVFYACDFHPIGGAQAAPDPTPVPSAIPGIPQAASVPVSSPPILHSRPGATRRLFLDFNGHVVSGTQWNTSAGVASWTCLPYDTDGDSTTFSDAEQAAITEIWRRVAEDYAPFDVDVTTEQPATMTSTTARALITRNTDASGVALPSNTAGGVAYTSVFGETTFVAVNSPAFIYYNNLAGGAAASVAEATAHELGHNLGLTHDGTLTQGGGSYYGGHGTGETSWGPIMGTGYGRNLSQWSKGEYYDANNPQDDLAIISASLGYRADDVGNTPATATAATVDAAGALSATGVIERSTDADVFSISTAAGPITINAAPYRATSGTFGGDLDLKLELLDAAGAVLVTADPAATTTAQIATTVATGTYYLRVSGVGTGTPLANPPAGYTAYASLGQYSLTGTVNAAAPAITSATVATVPVGQPFTFAIIATNSPASYGATGLPAGLVLDSTSGVISGAPTVTGVFSVSLSATNALGTGTAGLTLTVNSAPPYLTAQPTGLQTVNSGGSLALTAAAFSANGGVTWQWKRNGFVVAGATGASLALNPAAMSDNGFYQVLATNTIGTTASAPVFVRVAPASTEVRAWGFNGYGQIAVPAALGNVVALTGGGHDSVAVKPDGTLAAWGFNQNQVPAGLGNVLAVSVGFAHGLALKLDGSIVGWGNNVSGQTTIPAGLTNVVALSAGGYHSLALKADGTVTAWGRNTSGEATIPAGLNTVAAIAAGFAHSLALKADGTVAAWGGNAAGQTTIPAGLANVVALAAGYDFSLALKADGTVVGWGANTYGQTTIPAGLANVAAIAAGDGLSVALKTDGTVVAWGRNGDGQRNVPANLANVASLSAGAYHVLVMRDATGDTLPVISVQPVPRTAVEGTSVTFAVTASGGTAPLSYQWRKGGATIAGATNATLVFSSVTPADAGSYDVSVSDRLGSVTSATAALAVNPLPVISAQSPSRVTIASWQNLALSVTASATGAVSYQWLRNGLPVAGATAASFVRPAPATTDAGVYAVNVTDTSGTRRSAAMFVAVVPSVTEVRGWGDNTDGRATPPAGLASAIAVAAGDGHSLALKADGTVVGWGFNTNGQATIPAGLANAVAIAAGYSHSLALRADGTVIGWGDNTSGQVTIPAGLGNVVGVAAGGFHSLALKADGTVVAWGYNLYGQTAVPAGLANAIAVAAGIYYSVALKADGTVVAWGRNDYGQGTPPAGLGGVVAIASGNYHALALKSDGTVAGWGRNDYSQTNVSAGLATAVSVSGSYVASFAVKSDGSLAAWGNNSWGQISPPAGLDRLFGAAAGTYHALAVRDASILPPAVAAATVISATGFTANWSAVAGATGYRLDVATDAAFTALVANNNDRDVGAATSAVVTGLAASTNYYYRVRAVGVGGAGANSVGVAVTTAAVVPTITAPPAGKLAGVDTGTTFTVAATGTGTLTYQWKKDGVALTDSGRISGATTATLSLANLTLTDAGSYTVVVTNGGGSTTATAAALTVVDARATHAAVGAGYVAGGTVTITQTLTYDGACTGLGWQLLLPTGWSYASGGGAEAEGKPTVGMTSLLDWAWTTVPASPVTFTVTLNVPADSVGEKTITALAKFSVAAGQASILVKPDPLSVPQVTLHSADTDRNLRISLVELTRVIELYNTRNGTIRTGCYGVQTGTEDGFALDPTRAGGTVVTLARYHSADENRDGKLSLVELTRLIELYNTRNGTTRTGQYHVQAGTEDGFAPGP